MENSENKEFGKLFNSVSLISEEHLELIVTTMSQKEAIYLLVQAVKHAHHLGTYSIGETEVISKSIRVISKINDDEPKNT
jgi:20S proteasome alpha/beta subunit